MKNEIVLAVGILAWLAPATFGGELDTNLVLVVEDQHLRGIPGAVVEIVDGQSAVVYSADSNGAVPFALVDSGEELIIDLREMATREGTSIAQRYRVTPPAPSGQAGWVGVVAELIQPIAGTRYVDSSGLCSSAPQGFTWQIFPPTPLASYSFSADIAALLVREQLEAYADYYDTLLPREYEAALVLRCYAPIDLGPTGIGVAIAASHIPFSGPLVVDTAHFAPTERDWSTSTMVATDAFLMAGFAVVHLEGQLGTGDNLVLLDGRLSPGPSGPVDYSKMTKQAFTLSGPPVLASNSGVCIPPPPADPTEAPCLPAAPAYANCNIPEMVGAPTLTTTPFKLGPVLCGTPMESGTIKAELRPLNVSIAAKIKSFFGFEVTGTFGLPSSGLLWAPNFDAGANGNGQCLQMWGLKVNVYQKWESLEYDWEKDDPYCSLVVHYMTQCYNEFRLSTSCDRP